MARAFIRFVAIVDNRSAIWASGVICMIKEYTNDGLLDAWAVDSIQEIIDWLNENLPCPPFSSKLSNGEWGRDAVCWFRDTAMEPIKAVQELADILKQNGATVRKIRTDTPGKIVYEDDYQVVAETSEYFTTAR